MDEQCRRRTNNCTIISACLSECVTCGGGEHLLPVCDRVPLGGAVGEARVVDAVDDREHAHQAVVAAEGEGEDVRYSV